MTKMNKLTRFLLAATLGLLSTTASAALLTLHSSASSIHVGESFTLDVLLQDPFTGHEAGEELLAFGFNLDYDGAAFSLVSRTAGPLWTEDSEFTGLDLSGWAYPGIAEQGGSILLGQLTFTALASGSFGFAAHGDPAIDFLQGLYYASGAMENLSGDTMLNVAPPVSEVPAPAAGWLLGSGLLGLMTLRRRRL